VAAIRTTTQQKPWVDLIHLHITIINKKMQKTKLGVYDAKVQISFKHQTLKRE
jgi:hypothetical protein